MYFGIRSKVAPKYGAPDTQHHHNHKHDDKTKNNNKQQQTAQLHRGPRASAVLSHTRLFHSTMRATHSTPNPAIKTRVNMAVNFCCSNATACTLAWGKRWELSSRGETRHSNTNSQKGTKHSGKATKSKQRPTWFDGCCTWLRTATPKEWRHFWKLPSERGLPGCIFLFIHLIVVTETKTILEKKNEQKR